VAAGEQEASPKVAARPPAKGDHHDPLLELP